MAIPVWLKAEVTYRRTGSRFSSKTAGVVILGDAVGSEKIFTKDELALILCEIIIVDGLPLASFRSSFGNVPGLDVASAHFDLAGFLGMSRSALLSYKIKIRLLSGGCGLSQLEMQ